jgi:5-oxoprolinase (ATP-hydrolysing)
VFNNLFMSIAEQMGVTLQNTAYSVNIKERLDFSCAVFDRTGRWSPTRRTCRCIWARWTSGGNHHPPQRRHIHPGDVFALNAPYNGGTHLPDITVVTPVFDR